MYGTSGKRNLFSTISWGCLREAHYYLVGMSNHEAGDFAAYVGGPQIHDATVVRFNMLGKNVDVVLKGEDGRIFRVALIGVHSVKSNRPEGMVLYALAEMKPEGSLRRFSFVNWDENDDAFLEITAREYRIEEV